MEASFDLDFELNELFKDDSDRSITVSQLDNLVIM